MAKQAVQVIVAAFHQPDAARQALRTLKDLHGEALVGLVDAAVVARCPDGAVRVCDARDVRGGAGFAVGALTGAVLGLLAGQPGAAALGGREIGELAARLRRGGLEADRLRRVGEALTPDWSVLVAVVERRWAVEVAREVGQNAAIFVMESPADDVAHELRAGADVLYMLDDNGQAVFAGRATKAAADTLAVLGDRRGIYFSAAPARPPPRRPAA